MNAEELADVLKLFRVPSVEILVDRDATCPHCNTKKPSLLAIRGSLAFFQYRGPGSEWEVDTCKHCKYKKVAHEKKQAGELVTKHVCDNFEPNTGGYETDTFYCGCRGWD